MSALVMTLNRSSGTSAEGSISGLRALAKLPAIYRRETSAVEGTTLTLEETRNALTETGLDLRYPFTLPQDTEFGNIRLIQQLPVILELDDDGTFILSDELFDRYGTGSSPQAAYVDLMEDLSVYHELIAESATKDYPAAQALFGRLQGYIQLIEK